MTTRIPTAADLAAELAADTHAFRMAALERVAVDGFPRSSGQTVKALLDNGWIRPLRGHKPYELTVAGIDALLAHREANRR